MHPIIMIMTIVVIAITIVTTIATVVAIIASIHTIIILIFIFIINVIKLSTPDIVTILSERQILHTLAYFHCCHDLSFCRHGALDTDLMIIRGAE